MLSLRKEVEDSLTRQGMQIVVRGFHRETGKIGEKRTMFS